jgi:diphthamide biosynthesis enzyme Dph1/Dph2-like protein
MNIDINHCIDSLLTVIDRTKCTTIFYDEMLHHSVVGDTQQLQTAINSHQVLGGCNMHVAAVATTQTRQPRESEQQQQQAQQELVFGRVAPTQLANNDQHQLVWIGSGGTNTFDALVFRYNQCQVFTYNPITLKASRCSLSTSRTLMRRYYLVQKAKDANTIGILVGTLAPGMCHR